ncbi:RnfH family protein [Modicisalibacter radicis]|uniref:RnfH family protein n=1 Tax=Halomonas sp. EAR18 TaxID=2518972 RepID=UPI00109C7A74|nr:RnfH family protein [Halomonas sp. EAR18]
MVATEPHDEPAAINVEVAFALPQRQRIVALTLAAGTTAREAVRCAELGRHFPELPASTFLEAELGIFGKVLREPHKHVLQPGDRIEVYRPLLIDPKQARRQRADRSSDR